MMIKFNKEVYSKIYKRCYVRYDKIKEVEELIQFCFDSFDGITEPTCLLIIGDSGLGKSLIVEIFHEKHPDYNEDLEDEVNTIKPIVRFSLPSNAKRYEAIRAFLKSVGDPKWDSGESFDLKNERLIRYLKKTCKTKLIIIDEFHHLTQAISTKEITATSEWLKLIIKDTCIPVIGLGMPWAQLLQTSNKQCGTIFTMVEELFPFKVDDKKSLELYFSFLNTLLHRIKKEHSIAADLLIEPEVALPLFISSEGYPKIVMKIIARACSLAPKKELKLEQFQKAFKFVLASSKKNPFISNYEDVPAKQIEAHPTWDISNQKIVVPKTKDINIREILNLGKGAGLF